LYISAISVFSVVKTVLLFGSLLAGCAGLQLPSFGSSSTPTPAATETRAPTAAPTTETPGTPAGPTVLNLWVPPEFDPSGGLLGSELLQTRLDEYTAQRPEVRIEVRVKAADGPGGILDTLSSANAAAPLALPDLALLAREQLETAALKGLLFPYEGLSAPLEAGDWFPYAQQLARVQDSTFGLPFAGDALVLLYRPAEIETTPRDWASALETAKPLAFPAADLGALFTLAQYQSTLAPIFDEEGRPLLEAAALEEVLAFYQQGEAAGLIPVWLSQLTTDEEAWQAYMDARASFSFTWASRYFSSPPGDTSADLMPTRDGTPFALADGWVWALTNPQTDRHSLSVDLAEFLTAADFLADWTAEAGYLPPRAEALAGWSNASLRNLADRIVRSAAVLPPNDVLAAVGPALQEATLNVLRQQSDPETAAREAAESLETP
jgi:multiple sugar transport system substrate-binding protein